MPGIIMFHNPYPLPVPLSQVRGANNPKEQTLGPGTKDYPLLYYANKYQQVSFGFPA